MKKLLFLALFLTGCEANGPKAVIHMRVKDSQGRIYAAILTQPALTGSGGEYTLICGENSK